MDDTPEIIRQQMGETMLQLSEKLETLQQQVTETVQSTGTAVNATVGAVQETVETVTGAVQHAVHSVSNAFDLKRQIHQHPWLVIGGSVALGYLASELLTGLTKKSQPQSSTNDNTSTRHGDSATEPSETATVTPAVEEPGLKTSSWQQLRDMALGALVGLAREVATRVVPPMVDYLTGHQAGSLAAETNSVGKQPGSQKRQEFVEAVRRHSFGDSDGVRSGNSF